MHTATRCVSSSASVTTYAFVFRAFRSIVLEPMPVYLCLVSLLTHAEAEIYLSLICSVSPRGAATEYYMILMELRVHAMWIS